MTGARYLNRTIPPRAVRGTSSLTGARYFNRTIPPRVVRGTLSLTGARYLNRTIPPRAVQGTCHLIPVYSIVKGLVKYPDDLTILAFTLSINPVLPVTIIIGVFLKAECFRNKEHNS